ncbi:MAG TPA: gfo/Idh/MocA family oxidoreductase, partial [Candidatus Avipropionibacterium avicola]|nr:gfo/Idh/MocA family oxidoreductase [Candidatus Avipropionibacterium avicola]
EVEVDTHVTALLQHRDGALTTLVVSFDVQASRLPLIEVYGTAGTLAVPDPNQFDATVAVAHRRGEDFTPLEPSAGHAGTGRGIGLADMVRALRAGTAHRQDVALGLHVHEVMEAVLTSSADGSPVRVSAGCERPEPVPYEAHPA